MFVSRFVEEERFRRRQEQINYFKKMCGPSFVCKNSKEFLEAAKQADKGTLILFDEAGYYG